METKVWIEDAIEVAWNRGFSDTEMADILRMIETNLPLINAAYDELLA